MAEPRPSVRTRSRHRRSGAGRCRAPAWSPQALRRRGGAATASTSRSPKASSSPCSDRRFGQDTLLRIIAGLRAPRRGDRRARWRRRRDTPTSVPRNVNTVFQDYALFPHMTVRENIEYGLRVREVGRASGGAAPRVLDLVRLATRERAGAAFRRPAPARRAGTGDRQRARGAAPRRAAGRARPQAPPGDADRAQAHPARGRDHLRLRDARPGGGADDERPPRRDEQGADRAARHTRDVYERPGDANSSPASSASPTCSSATAAGSPCGRRRSGSSGTTTRLRPDVHVEAGEIVEVIYLGVVTRYVVKLDGGENLVAGRQNRETAAADVRGATRTQGHGVAGVRNRPTRSAEPVASPEEEKAHEADTGSARRLAAGGGYGGSAGAVEQSRGGQARVVRERHGRSKPPRRQRAGSDVSRQGRRHLNLIAWEGYTEPSGSSRSSSRPAARSTPSTRAPPARWCR